MRLKVARDAFKLVRWVVLCFACLLLWVVLFGRALTGIAFLQAIGHLCLHLNCDVERVSEALGLSGTLRVFFFIAVPIFWYSIYLGRLKALDFGVLVTSSYLLLVVRPGAPSSVLAPSSNARSP